MSNLESSHQVLIDTHGVGLRVLVAPRWLYYLLYWLILSEPKTLYCTDPRHERLLLGLAVTKCAIYLRLLLGKTRERSRIEIDFSHDSTTDYALILNHLLLTILRLLRICVEILDIVARLHNLLNFVLGTL